MLLGSIVGLIITYLPEGNILNWVQTYLTEGLFSLMKTWFVNSLKLIVVPLVIVSIVCGTCSLSDPKKLGSMGSKSILLYLMTTTIAVVLGISFAIIFEPGAGVSLSQESFENDKESSSIFAMLAGLITTNIFKSMLEADMLQLIIFSILFGVSIAMSGEKGKPIADFFASLNEVIMKLVTIIMKFAPYGIFCIVAMVIAESKWDEIKSLSKYFGLVLFVLVLHGLIVYPTLLKLLAKLNPIDFLMKFRPTILFAFGSSSSSATLPVTMEIAQKRLGVGKTTSSFVLPLGATINMDGTAIM
jgi:DAACS family dicarboxylate/amino acid:cation (Na+ or H+) symporter